jgi:hypothetical protein
LGDIKGVTGGPLRDCKVILDPWRGKGEPKAYDDDTGMHEFNYVHGDEREPSQKWEDGKWKDAKYADIDNPIKPPADNGYKPITDWKPKEAAK